MDEYVKRRDVIRITEATGALTTQESVKELPAAEVIALGAPYKLDGYFMEIMEDTPGEKYFRISKEEERPEQEIRRKATDAEGWEIIQRANKEITIRNDKGEQETKFTYKEIEDTEQLKQILMIWRFIHTEVGRVIDDRIAKGAMK